MHETSWNTVCQFCGTKHCWRTEIDRLRRELEEHQAAKWKEKHVDTMNDMAALRIALEGVEAQLSDARRELEEARKALEPFADAVFNDNGDMTVNRSFPTYDDFVRAYFAHKKARAAFKAPGKMRKPTDHEYELIAGSKASNRKKAKVDMARKPAGAVTIGTVPMYWMHETTGLLRPAIEAYLRHEPMTPQQIAAMRAYLRQWIGGAHWAGEKVDELRRSIDGLTSQEAIREWLGLALDEGIDPL